MVLGWTTGNTLLAIGLVVFGLLGLLIVFGIAAAWRARKLGWARQGELRALANKLGLGYSVDVRPALPDLGWFREAGAYGLNTFQGREKAWRIQMGDFHFVREAIAPQRGHAGETAHSLPVDHFVSYCQISGLASGFPALTIRHATVWDQVNPGLLEEDIEFESSAFSAAFFVRCRERQFASTVVTPALMEYCLAHPGYWIHLNGEGLVLHRGEKLWTAAQFEDALLVARRILALIPPQVWEAYLLPGAEGTAGAAGPTGAVRAVKVAGAAVAAEVGVVGAAAAAAPVAVVAAVAVEEVDSLEPDTPAPLGVPIRGGLAPVVTPTVQVEVPQPAPARVAAPVQAAPPVPPVPPVPAESAVPRESAASAELAETWEAVAPTAPVAPVAPVVLPVSIVPIAPIAPMAPMAPIALEPALTPLRPVAPVEAPPAVRAAVPSGQYVRTRADEPPALGVYPEPPS